MAVQTKVSMVNTLLRFKSKVEGTITVDSWPDFSAILSHQHSEMVRHLA